MTGPWEEPVSSLSDGVFLTPRNEKFSEGMVNFQPVVESCGHIARSLESVGLVALRG